MGSKNYVPPCYQSHKPMPIGNHFVYGGSCINPKITDADIYVGLDGGMIEHLESYPWYEDRQAFKFEITNMRVPDDAMEFHNLISYLHEALLDDAKIHIGCIGGHGRTGLVLAALVKVATGNPKAIQYVRKRYCPKAVETDEQIKWLGKHFKIHPAKPRYTAADLDRQWKKQCGLDAAGIALLDDWRAK
jgi:protein-tyrosine phosphatase